MLSVVGVGKDNKLGNQSLATSIIQGESSESGGKGNVKEWKKEEAL